MAPQISRILLVFGSLAILYVGVRTQVVQEGFEKDAFHRADATTMLAGLPKSFAGREACDTCHSDKAEESNHSLVGVGCESCHGPAGAHAEDYESGTPRVPSERKDCARCHTLLVGRPEWFPQQDIEEHNPGMPCMDCHDIHPEPYYDEDDSDEGSDEDQDDSSEDLSEWESEDE